MHFLYCTSKQEEISSVTKIHWDDIMYSSKRNKHPNIKYHLNTYPRQVHWVNSCLIRGCCPAWSCTSPDHPRSAKEQSRVELLSVVSTVKRSDGFISLLSFTHSTPGAGAPTNGTLMSKRAPALIRRSPRPKPLVSIFGASEGRLKKSLFQLWVA